MEYLLFILTLLAALGSGLVAGIFFAFSAFVMSALGRVAAQCGIAAMQSINVTVLNPLFFTVFFGTAVLSMPSTSSSRRASASRPPTWTRTRRSLQPRWQRRAAPRRQKTLAEKLVRETCVVRSPVPRLRHDNHDFAQRLSYSSWRRYQTLPRRSPAPTNRLSLRPRGARSSHWYMPQRPSSPRAYAE